MGIRPQRCDYTLVLAVAEPWVKVPERTLNKPFGYLLQGILNNQYLRLSLANSAQGA